MTFNIRGCDSASKRRRISKIIQKGKFDLCLIQERKTQVVHEGIVKGLWGRHEIVWSAKGAEGQSGGILIVWNQGLIVPKFNFTGSGFLNFNAEWKGIIFYFISIYSSYNLSYKRKLWAYLLNLKKQV